MTFPMVHGFTAIYLRGDTVEINHIDFKGEHVLPTVRRAVNFMLGADVFDTLRNSAIESVSSDLVYTLCLHRVTFDAIVKYSRSATTSDKKV